MKPTFIFLFLLSAFCGSCETLPYTISGRALEEPDRILLIGPASSVAFSFSGDYCQIMLHSGSQSHNYVSLELDGNYIGRVRIESGMPKAYKVAVKTPGKHELVIYKATESAQGTVVFSGAKARDVNALQSKKKKKIEFIGDSITCGMGNDLSGAPCDTAEWFDQHNAYLAYGPVLSRELGVDFLLSSVSGIGMYRNWNDEHQQEAIMPDVYEKLYLNKTENAPFPNDYQPDVVSICLGTNDLSNGDGTKPRLAFNPEKYVSNYIAFVGMIQQRYPSATIVLLNSPMVSGEKNVEFVSCLKKVASHFNDNASGKPIRLFEFKPMTPKGCGYHPDASDHQQMAAELKVFFSKLLNEN